jgi:hypothetical protein
MTISFLFLLGFSVFTVHLQLHCALLGLDCVGWGIRYVRYALMKSYDVHKLLAIVQSASSQYIFLDSTICDCQQRRMPDAPDKRS